MLFRALHTKTFLTSRLLCPTSQKVVKAFSPNSGVVNALSFISAVVLLSFDSESPNPTRSKCDLIFDIFDFHDSGDMSLDEVTILLLR